MQINRKKKQSESVAIRTGEHNLYCHWHRSVQGALGMVWFLGKLCKRKCILPVGDGKMSMASEVAEWNAKTTVMKQGDWFDKEDYDKHRPTESDPNGLDLKTPGSKADYGKAPVLQGAFQYFPRALRAVSLVSQVGARKYSWKGWESVPDGINRYGNALGRHILDEAIDGPIDKDTGLSHASQQAWNALARLELILREKENPKQKEVCTLGEWKELTKEQAGTLGLK